MVSPALRGESWEGKRQKRQDRKGGVYADRFDRINGPPLHGPALFWRATRQIHFFSPCSEGFVAKSLTGGLRRDRSRHRRKISGRGHRRHLSRRKSRL